jgi:hypothetical protein
MLALVAAAVMTVLVVSAATGSSKNLRKHLEQGPGQKIPPVFPAFLREAIRQQGQSGQGKAAGPGKLCRAGVPALHPKKP